MRQFISFGVSGLTTAAIYAIAASGLVLTYTTTGTFNFAHGATGMVAAFAYWQLRFGWHWPAPLALAMCLLVLAPLFGAMLEVVIMRGLRGTAETTRLVVTIGLLVSLLGAALWIWKPSGVRPTRKFWDGSVVTIWQIRIPYHQIAVLVIAGLVALGLRVLLYRTRVGIGMRASVDDRSLAMLTGARPDRVSMLAWSIGSSLAALSGILISPTVTLAALPLTLLTINAYAAAMMGRLRSLPYTFVGALILGMANDYGNGYLTKIHLAHQYLNGLVASIPVIVLFVVLLILPNPRLRGHQLLRTREVISLPTWSGAVMLGACVVAGTALIAPFLGASDLLSVSKLFAIAIVGLSLVPLVGYGGHLSLCPMTFAGIGAIVMAHLGQSGNPLALVAAGLIAGLVGALIALPALRLSGIYLALSTAAFAVAMDNWIFALPKFTVFGHDINLFEDGSLSVSRLRLFGLRFEGSKAYFVLLSAIFVVFAFGVVAIRRSNFGLRLLAAKDSPAACATLGLNLTFTKLAVFALSAFMAGVGGALYGGAVHITSPDPFSFFNGLTIVLVMVIAGISTIGGALACGIALGAPILGNLFPSLTELTLVLSGLGGIGLARNPNGFIHDIRARWSLVEGDPVSQVSIVGLLAVVWLLRATNVMGNWPFAVGALVVLAVGPLIAQVRFMLARSTVASSSAAGGYDFGLPLEWLGIDRPFTDADVAALDAALAGDG
jgi:branched-chain amino acid transport system permease protein